jgi:hypothetical protein
MRSNNTRWDGEKWLSVAREATRRDKAFFRGKKVN